MSVLIVQFSPTVYFSCIFVPNILLTQYVRLFIKFLFRQYQQ